ncbi:MAG: hypothetical protein AB1635_20975 [Acidobacteriota bacterium]
MTGAERQRVTGVTLFYVALAVALAWPVSVNPGSRLLVDNPDAELYIWTLAWNAHAFVAQPLSIFDANIYHPYPNTLAYSENLIGSALIAAPVIWLTGNLVLAVNVVQMLSLVLSGLGAYLLARRAGVGPLGAVLAGIVFLAAPPRFMRLGQLHLTTIQWVPFGLYFLHGYLDTGRARDLRLALWTFTLQAVTSGHGTIFLGVSMLALVLYRVALGERLALRHRARDVGVAGALALGPLVLVFLPYRAAQRDVGLVRTLENWLPTPESYLASPSHLHQWLRALVTDVDFNAAATAWLFPGVTVLVLALLSVLTLRAQGPGGWRERLRTDPGAFYVLLAVLAVLFIVPPPLGLWPHVYWMPGLNFIRVPSRFMILAMLALGVAAGAGFDRLAAGLRSGGRRVAFLALAALFVAEYFSAPVESVRYRIEIPAVDRWLATQPGPFVVAEVPVPSPRNAGAFERHHTMAMLHATAHWQKTVHGYSGIRPPLHERLYRELAMFPDETSLASLREVGVTYVVVHEELYRPHERADVEARFARFADQLRLEHAAPTGRVYRVLAP